MPFQLPIFGKGEDSRTAKLTERQVDEIRRLYHDGAKQRDLAKSFGVALGTINRIVTYRGWK